MSIGHHVSFFKNNFIYLFIFGYTGSLLLRELSVVVVSGGYSLVGVHGLLSALAPGPAGFEPQRLQHVGPAVVVPGPQSTGSIVAVHGLSHDEVPEILPDQGWNPCLLRCRQILYHLGHSNC